MRLCRRLMIWPGCWPRGAVRGLAGAAVQPFTSPAGPQGHHAAGIPDAGHVLAAATPCSASARTPSQKTPVLIRLNDPETKFGSAQVSPNVPIGAPGTAPLHFTLTREGMDRLRLREFGHGYGPYRYGLLVRRSELLEPGDHFDFADCRYHVRDGCTELERTPLGPVDVIVADLDVKSPSRSAGWLWHRTAPKPLLVGMTFIQRQKTLLAVVGRSGSGKTSLLSVLIGDLPMERGSLFLQGLDLRTRSEQVSHKLGYVPQDTNTVYSSLTVRQLLQYSFHLRDAGTVLDRENASEKSALTLNSLTCEIISCLPCRVGKSAECRSPSNCLVSPRCSSWMSPHQAWIPAWTGQSCSSFAATPEGQNRDLHHPHDYAS